ncbi:MAG TPA: peptidoglycan-associated lipoprotein Pal [Gammaproteobacteria bacterium]
MRAHTILIACLAVLALAGCKNQEAVPDGSAGAAGTDGASTSGAGGSGSGAFQPIPGGEATGGNVPPGLMDQLVVYFDFDSSDIKPDFNSMLAAHGQYLAANSGVQLRLEGHADERGSREYNIGLGERRAQAVRRILMLQGATAAQLTTVSYGEERPAVFGSDEESYSLNRRVELVYR